LQPGETRIVKVSGNISNAHFWSWGYGYLYTVNSILKSDDGRDIDHVATRTGFRKTRFGEGKVWLNDRVISIHGYAQRTSNEWPGVGMSVPAWLSDYSNKLQVESGGNLVRWMHVTPWKQDVESCDRVGLIESMPAGDANMMLRVEDGNSDACSCVTPSYIIETIRASFFMKEAMRA